MIDHVVKSCAAQIKALDEKTFTATITTESVDRDHEVVLAKGLNLDRFRENPTVLFGHEHDSFPIGKATTIELKGNKVVATVTPAPTERGAEAFKLIQGGFLNSVSIGFKPLEGGPPTEKELTANPLWKGTRTIFRSADLLEFSVVNVPANPDAKITAVSKRFVKMLKHHEQHEPDSFAELEEAEAAKWVGDGVAEWATSGEAELATGKVLDLVSTTLTEEIAEITAEYLGDPESFTFDDRVKDQNYTELRRLVVNEIRRAQGRIYAI